MYWTGLDWTGMGWTVPDWHDMDWDGPNWIGLMRIAELPNQIAELPLHVVVFGFLVCLLFVMVCCMPCGGSRNMSADLGVRRMAPSFQMHVHADDGWMLLV